jgi:hypothetical protein
MTSLHEAALAYAADGWPIFPVQEGDKKPLIAEWQNKATTNPAQIDQWWTEHPDANIGFVPGLVGMMVLDLDPGHSMKELEKNVGPVPQTDLRSETPRGGEHLFFELAQNEVVAPSASKLAPHVDVRSHNSYVLLAPSVTSSGSYRWTGGNLADGKPAYRTDELVRFSNTAKDKHESRHTWIIEPNLPENVETAKHWLRHVAKPAIEGQGGDATAYATASMMVSYGISQDLALELMVEHWNQRCIPPWNDGELDYLETKVENAYGYHENPPGNVTPAYKEAQARQLFEPVLSKSAAGGHEWKLGKFRTVDWGGMSEIPEPSWLIDNLLPVDSYAMLYAPPSSYKTFVALDMALSVASGWPVDPVHEVARQGDVLYITSEGRSALFRRAEAWAAHHAGGMPVSSFYLADPVPGIEELDAELLIENALNANSDGYKMIVLDTVARSMQGQDENSSQAATMFTAMVEKLMKGLGGSVLAVHHTGKNKDNGPRGSSAFLGDVDVAYSVEPAAGKDEALMAKLTQTKVKDGEAWTQPRIVRMHKHTVFPGNVSTLVPMRGQADDLEPQAPEPQYGYRNGHPVRLDRVDYDVIAAAALDTLTKYPGKKLSDRKLADMVAMRDDMFVSGETLRKHLKTIREEGQYAVGRYYDVGNAEWVGKAS